MIVSGLKVEVDYLVDIDVDTADDQVVGVISFVNCCVEEVV